MRVSWRGGRAWGYPTALAGTYLAAMVLGAEIATHWPGRADAVLVARPWYEYFWHNSVVLLELVMLGILTAGMANCAVFPAMGLFSGTSIGLAARVFGVVPTVASVSVHGLVETGGLVVACTVAKSFGTCMWGVLLGRERSSGRIRDAAMRLARGIGIGMGLLLTAAGLESIVSPWVVRAL